MNITCNECKKEWLPSVALLHQQGIPTGFLSALGPGFLAALYGAIATSRWSRVFTAVPEGTDRPVGFIAASIDTGRMYRDVLLRSGLRFAWHLAPQIARPAVVKNMLETILYPVIHAKEAKAGAGALSQPSSIGGMQAELLAIAVDKEWQGKGIGRLLVNEMERYFKESKVERYKVVTSRQDETANAFYKALGYGMEKTFLHHRREMCQYIKTV
jgi:ribosomal protein S18 acetylase RimI-like enzyme